MDRVFDHLKKGGNHKQKEDESPGREPPIGRQSSEPSRYIPDLLFSGRAQDLGQTVKQLLTELVPVKYQSEELNKDNNNEWQ